MSTQLEVTIKGPPGAMDARVALVRLEELLDLLGELENADRRSRPAKRRPPRSKWTFAELAIGSVKAALVPLEPRSGSTFEDLDHVPARAVAGFTQTEEQEVLPDGWSIDAARAARRLAGGLGASTDLGMRLSLVVDGRVSATIDVTRRSSVHLDRALQVRRESIGSVSGAIDSMSVHKKPYAGLWSGRGGGRVIVDLPNQNVIDQAREALGKIATVRGRIRRNGAGQILGVKASGIEVVPMPTEATPLSSIVGAFPDLADGLDPSDYLEAVREQA